MAVSEHSTQDTRTAPCKIRFVNNSDQVLEILWLDYQGQEQRYALVEARSQHTQGEAFQSNTRCTACSKANKVQASKPLRPTRRDLHNSPMAHQESCKPARAVPLCWADCSYRDHNFHVLPHTPWRCKTYTPSACSSACTLGMFPHKRPSQWR